MFTMDSSLLWRDMHHFVHLGPDVKKTKNLLAHIFCTCHGSLTEAKALKNVLREYLLYTVYIILTLST